MGTLAVGRVALAAAAIAAVLTLTACGERTEPTGASAELYPVTVTSPSGDRPLVLETPAKRIAVLSPVVGRIVADLGATKQIAGTPLQANGTVKTEDLKAMRPDLLLASSDTDQEVLAAAGKAAARVPVYVAQVGDIRSVERTIIQLGLATDKSVAARRLVRAIEDRRAAVRKRLAGVPGVSVFVDRGAFTTFSNQSLVGDLLREAHARNVAGESTQLGPFDLVELARLDPYYYLATSDSGTTLADLRARKLTKVLAAVRAGRFAIVDARLLDPGPGIGRGLTELARTLHPNAFK
jgi:ABC-type Fe3+-hydroxamate transport system substrate-binding protein